MAGRPRKEVVPKVKKAVGRPRKYLSPDIKKIVRTIQNGPFNQSNPEEWTELLGRLAIFQKETKRTFPAALWVLLDSALKNHEKTKEN